MDDVDASRELRRAIEAYSFPTVTYDFARGVERRHASMREVEAEIHSCLLAGPVEAIRDGLSNLLYWGNARIGYRNHRVQRFRTRVTLAQLEETGATFRGLALDESGLNAIKRLRLPEFSQVSFISKLRMFLDPTSFVTLDLKIASLGSDHGVEPLRSLVVRSGIPVSRDNEQVYMRWCAICRSLAASLDDAGGVRSVDVERGVFELIDTKRSGVAAIVVQDANART